MKKLLSTLTVILALCTAFIVFANAEASGTCEIFKNEVSAFNSVDFTVLNSNADFTVENIIDAGSNLYKKYNSKAGSTVSASAFEAFITERFDVTAEALRGSKAYNSTKGTYTLASSHTDDVVTFLGSKKGKSNYSVWFSRGASSAKASLTVRLTVSLTDSVVKYIGYRTGVSVPDDAVCPDGWVTYPGGNKSYFIDEKKMCRV